MTEPPTVHSARAVQRLWVGFLLLYVALTLLFLTSQPRPISFDELVHYSQINLFDHGIFRIYEDLPMLPGYHLLCSAILRTTGLRSLTSARILNELFGLGALGAFYLLRRRLWPRNAVLATLQFALLPILLPYDFFVYTDVLSVGLVLAAATATVAEMHVASGLIMVVAACIRQNNVVWLPLLMAMAAWPIRWPNFQSLRSMTARLWPYALGIVLFFVYWKWNGSIALSKIQSTMHPDLSVHIGNLYFTLFMCAFFFPLHMLMGLQMFAKQVSTRPWLSLIPLAAFMLFWTMFHVDHPFNKVTDPFILHNYLIQQCEANPWFRAAFGVLSISAACGLACTPLRPGGAKLLYPVAAVALAASWMIEDRYALIALALWLAFREQRSARIEMTTTVLWLVLAVGFCICYSVGGFSL